MNAIGIRRSIVALAVCTTVTACASSGGQEPAAVESETASTVATTAQQSPATTAVTADTTAASTTTASTTAPSTTASTTSTLPATTPPVIAETGAAIDVSGDAALGTERIDAPATAEQLAARIGQQIELRTPVFDIGYSVEGRPIVAERIGKVGGRKVLVIGNIHGDEDAGIQIVDRLRTSAIDDGVELWLIESMNPDGFARQDRHNANEVDLNRNFPYKWGRIGSPGNSQYAGTGPASEPETRAIVGFITELRPDIAIWYHQDANLIIPSTGRDGRIRARYAELTALPLDSCCDGGGIYTGVAATWARTELKKTSDAVPFIVELPGGVLSEAQVTAHTNAVLTVGREG